MKGVGVRIIACGAPHHNAWLLGVKHACGLCLPRQHSAGKQRTRPKARKASRREGTRARESSRARALGKRAHRRALRVALGRDARAAVAARVQGALHALERLVSEQPSGAAAREEGRARWGARTAQTSAGACSNDRVRGQQALGVAAAATSGSSRAASSARRRFVASQ
jgi:hypothetical protein